MTAVDGAAGAVVCLMVEQLTCEMGLVGLGRIFASTAAVVGPNGLKRTSENLERPPYKGSLN